LFQSRLRSVFGCATVLALLLTVEAGANDGEIAFGGSPRLLKGHSTVSMQSERVKVDVGEETVTVDCRFVFRNNGPACSVRMGFPDEGQGGANPEQDGQVPVPRGTFTSFRSYVDGRPQATRLIRADRPGKYWHAKTVRFPARGQRLVRNVYTLPVGSQITRTSSLVRQAFYVLHTGASWNGPIGRTEVEVVFHRKRMAAPLRPVRMSRSGRDGVYAAKWAGDRARVYYQGPGRPQVSGKTLRFVRTNWRPAPSDDILLFFDNVKSGAG